MAVVEAKMFFEIQADRLTDVKIEIFGETVAQRYAEALSKNWLTG